MLYNVPPPDGYHAVGFSQGGLFIRGLAQRCPEPRIRSLVSIGGPQQVGTSSIVSDVRQYGLRIALICIISTNDKIKSV